MYLVWPLEEATISDSTEPVKRLGSSRCGQASKGVGGMPRRHQKSERGRLRNAWGSCRTSVDPKVLTKTQGTETSQYLEEQKSTEIPSVVASERGIA
jgi:hypothetical protein